ncbi:MAG: TIM barrel protein [Spongiibacteraceae bacterium]
MQLLLFKTLWGHGGDLTAAVEQALAAGFYGIEGPVPSSGAEVNALQRLLEARGIGFIGEICTAGSYVPRRQATPDEHLLSLQQSLDFATFLQPRFCNVIAGCDAWPLARQVDFFRRALDLCDRAGVLCSFETHRSRSLFNPWVTVQILEQIPELQITCDFSHWVVVCERLLDNEWDSIEYVAERALHIHGRVGYDQGPQVPHPAATEYADALASHQRCWETIWQAQRRRGFIETTLTPEFGPDGYLHCLPFTGMPVADLWQINRWMGDTERAHFQRWLAA